MGNKISGFFFQRKKMREDRIIIKISDDQKIKMGIKKSDLRRKVLTERETIK